MQCTRRRDHGASPSYKLKSYDHNDIGFEAIAMRDCFKRFFLFRHVLELHNDSSKASTRKSLIHRSKWWTGLNSRLNSSWSWSDGNLLDSKHV